MKREILFPTPVYFKMVKDPKKMNKYLFPLIKAWSKKDKSEDKKPMPVAAGTVPPI